MAIGDFPYADPPSWDGLVDGSGNPIIWGKPTMYGAPALLPLATVPTTIAPVPALPSDFAPPDGSRSPIHQLAPPAAGFPWQKAAMIAGALLVAWLLLRK